ncbi:MAG TPA: hypothetical protein VMF31_00720 [Solirubrobacterales bacterium]|nr:hypothetical protein [Solirubrobacterales bacterium]
MNCHFADCPAEPSERVPGFGEYCAEHAERARRLARLMPSAAPAEPDFEPDPTEPQGDPGE